MQVDLIACPQLQRGYEVVDGLSEVDSVVAYAISKCYRVKPNDRAIRRCYERGHTSVFEHIAFTFDIKGVSRVCLAQLTRHRMASYTVESQRYVNYGKKDLDYVVPAEEELFRKTYQYCFDVYNFLIQEGYKPEDARFVLPQAVETNLVMTINARSLFNFFEQRLNKAAQWEIRELAREMLELVCKVAPVTFEHIGGGAND